MFSSILGKVDKLTRRVLKVTKVSKEIIYSSSLSRSPHRDRKSHAIWDHSVNPAAVIDFPDFTRNPTLVLDLATPEGCKAELNWVVVIF